MSTTANEILIKFRDLDSVTETRLQRYRKYFNYFNGRQWQGGTREETRTYATTNLCEPTVTKFAALLMGAPPLVHVKVGSEVSPIGDIDELQEEFKGEETNFAVEANQSDVSEKLLNKILFKDNDGARLFHEAAMGGSLYGESILYHPYDPKTKSFKLENIFPGYFRAKFRDTNYKEMEHAFVVKLVSLTEIKRIYDFEASADSLEFAWKSNIWEDAEQLVGDYAMVIKYWDRDKYCVVINSKIVKEDKNKTKIMPFKVISNRWQPYSSWGRSDLKDVIPIQDMYNDADSDENDVVQLFSNPKVFLKGAKQQDIDAIKKVKGSNIIPLARGVDVQVFEFRSSPYPIQQRKEDIMGRYHMISGLPPVAFGTAQGSIVTGVAMTAQYAPTLQIVRAKMTVWQEQLEKMCEEMLSVLREHGGKDPKLPKSFKKIIPEDLRVELQFENKMPRDDAIYINNERSKLEGRLQSRHTTMTHLGVRSPDDEMKRIAWEEANPMLSPEMFLKMSQLEVEEDKHMVAAEASEENRRLEMGEPIPVPENSPADLKIHLEIHAAHVKNRPEMNQIIKQVFDQHMSETENKLRQGTGVPEQPEQPEPEMGGNMPTQALPPGMEGMPGLPAQEGSPGGAPQLPPEMMQQLGGGEPNQPPNA